MFLWAVTTASGLCTIVSFYMAFLDLKTDGNGFFQFSAFGLFWGVFFLAAVLRSVSNKGPFLQWLANKTLGKPEPVSFVPNWFLILALSITGIGILAALLVPAILK